MDDLDPRQRAEHDAEKAAEENAKASALTTMAHSLDSTAEVMTSLGYTDSATSLHATANQDIAAASYDTAAGKRLSDASTAWNTVAEDLTEQARVRGDAYVAGAEHHQAETMVHDAHSAAEQSNAQLLFAVTGTAQSTLNERADELGHEADAAAQRALADESAAHDIDPSGF